MLEHHMQFLQWFENDDQLQQLIKSLKAQHPEIQSLFVYESGHEVKLDDITILPEMRGKGVGSIVMQALKQFAASVGKPLVLTPDANKGKKGALDRFYRGHGLIYNKGRNKDYSLGGTFGPTMYWRPEKQ